MPFGVVSVVVTFVRPETSCIHKRARPRYRLNIPVSDTNAFHTRRFFVAGCRTDVCSPGEGAFKAAWNNDGHIFTDLCSRFVLQLANQI